MRAKTVEFERGRDPKDTLELGNKNLRYLNKITREKKWFAPLQPVINGLMEGSIPEKDAVNFIERAIVHYDTRKGLVWYEWFEESGNVFWDKQSEKMFITFEMPENETSVGDTEYLKIYCDLLQNESFIHDQTYQIHSWLWLTNLSGNGEEHFAESRLFYPDDEHFKMSVAINIISKVVEDTIKNIL